jgi:hypothetical protein
VLSNKLGLSIVSLASSPADTTSGREVISAVGKPDHLAKARA